MKLLMRKYLAVLVIVGVILLAVAQWWSYRQVGEILEDYPATSVVAGYSLNVSPLLPSLYVRSIGDSIVGYSYEPSDGTYVLLVRGRAGKPDEYYRLELQSLRNSYLDYLNLTTGYIKLWTETGNESAFNYAVGLLRRTLEARAELENFKRGENVTAVLMEPPYPYRLLHGENPLPGEIVVSLLLIVGTVLLLSRLDFLIEVLSDFRNLALLLSVIIGISFVFYGLIQERPDPFLSIKSNWEDKLNFCGERGYYVHRNAEADSLLLDALSSAEYARVWTWDGKNVYSVTLAMSPERTEGLINNLSQVTTVLHMYSVPPWPEPPEIKKALVWRVREDLLETGELDEGAVDAMIKASLENIELSMEEFSFCENVTIVTFEFGRDRW
ncbi:hypothetical protein [Thermococcus sp. 21S7]|uniref:hypothetical protein n=1 Tax=Thermococcus sp. 21S7 TaxID=1638221 RepID=UPI001438AED6|nr:hypothetical protein [Thermococcus sp. 21S7]NJE61465.1 hypothetical protein [Thermococcus sp. 21S7]